MGDKENIRRFALENVAVGAIYFLFAAFSLPADNTASLIWPASGFALASVLLRGNRLLPGLAGGALALALYARHAPVLTVLYILAVPLQAWFGAVQIRRFAGFRNDLHRLSDVAALIGIGAFLSPVIGATLGSIGLCLAQGQWHLYRRMWATWWIGDLMGILILAPVLLSFLARDPGRDLRRSVSRFAPLAASMTCVAFLAFSRNPLLFHNTYATAYLVYPAAVWASLKYGARGASLSTLIVAAVALYQTTGGQSAFIASESPFLSTIYLWLFLGVLGATSLTLAAVVEERQQAKQAAQAARLQLQTFIEHTPVAVAMFDREMRYLVVSDHWLKDYRLKERDILGKSHYEIFPEIGQDWKDDHRRVLNGEIYRREEDAFPRRDGTVDWLRYELHPWRDPEGAVGGIIMITEVITERKKAQDALRASEARYRNLVARLPGAIYRCGAEPQRPIESCSGYIETLTGWSPFELQQPESGGFEALIHPDDRAAAWRSIEDQLATGGQYIVEYRITRKDGLERYILDKGSRGAGGRSTASLDGVLFDMTDRRLREAEHLKAVKLESIGALAGGIAHDFNNILTEIRGNIELAQLEGQDAAGNSPRILDQAKRACDRATELARQLLTFAKGGDPVKKAIGVAEAIRQAATLCLHGSNCSCELVLPKDLWQVEADEEQLSQVFRNLILNAAEAMPRGGLITIRAENVPADRVENPHLEKAPHIAISIHDQGAGIEPRHLARIFDPYFTTKATSSGLGLPTAFSIVRRHRGVITAESEKGLGAVFRIHLPALAEASADLSPAPAAPEPTGQGRILVMDDEVGIQRLMETLLRRIGYEVVLSATGEEAIEKFREAQESRRPFDFVTLDLTIPGGMGGKEAVVRLRELDPNLIAIVVSGYSDDPIMSNCREYGFTAALSKPFSFQSLRSSIGAIEAERTGRKQGSA